MTMGPRIARLDRERALQKRQRLRYTLRHGHIAGDRTQQQIVGVKIFRPLTFDALDFCGTQARLHGTNDCERHLVLEGEDIVKRAIVSFGPEMGTGFRLDELTGDAHSVGTFTNAAFQHVTDAEFAADLLYIDHSTLVDEARVPRDDEQPFDA